MPDYSTHYSVIFDISNTRFSDWSFAIIGGVFLTIGVLIFVGGATLRTKVLAVIGAAFAVTAASVGQLSLLSEYRNLRAAYARGDYLVVEGRVLQFDPGSGAGNMPERFVVGGRAFEVSAPMRTAAYHKTVHTGGPNLSDRCVRIAFTPENSILWLGVARVGCAGEPIAADSIPAPQ